MVKFGTDGWRGEIAKDFTFENLGKAAYTYGLYIKKVFQNPEVIIGYDRRFLSKEFAHFCARVLSAQGVKVFVSETPVPTPAVSSFVVREKLSGGIVITASHNPYNFNGFKVKEWFGGPALPETTKKIEEFLQYVPEKIPEEQNYKIIDIISGYIEHIKRDVDMKIIKKAPRMIFDYMFGSASGLAKYIFKAIEIRTEHNPIFPGIGRPEPLPETLQELKIISRRKKLDGFAFDGDGDRIYAVSKGFFIDSHKLFAFAVEHIAKNRGKKGKVYKTFAASDLIDKVGEYWGLKVKTTPVGFKYVVKGMIGDEEKKDMEEGGKDEMEKVIIGGEESGGIGIEYHLKERDSLFVSAFIVEYMMMEGKDLLKLLKSMEKRFGKHRYARRDVFVSDEVKVSVMERVKSMEKICGMVVSDIDTLDGVKLKFSQGGFLLVRPSGTEPLLRIYCETQSEEKSLKIIEEVIKMTKK